MDWVGWVGVLVGGIGIGSLIDNFLNRRQATQTARTERRFNRRADTYQVVSLYLARQEQIVQLTEPLIGTGEEPPRIKADEEWVRLGASIAVTASDEIRDKLHAVVVAQQTFAYAVNQYRRSQQPGYQPDPAVNPGLEMHNAREATFAAIHAAQTAMRDELDAM
jgi:hypothetical protein